QQRLAAELQRRAERRTSFLGLIGRVSAAVGATALFPPVGFAGLIPTLSSIASSGNGRIALPQIAGASPTMQIAAEQAVTVATNRAIPSSTARPGPALLGAGAPDPYVGLWQCVFSTATTGVDGR